MDISSIAHRLRSADIEYALGRFKTVRRTYGIFRHLIDDFSAADHGDGVPGQSIFSGVDVDRVAATIHEDAVYIGLNLPAYIVEEIRAFALTEPLHAIYDPNGPTFRYADVVDGKAADGRSMPVGGIKDPLRCPAVHAVTNDPVLRAIVRRYLGHEPRKVMTLLHWTFASSMSDEQRRSLKHHVIDYHDDVGGYNFVYASFYITDTDRYSGAHVMMKRSHSRKPLRMLLGSAVASEAAVRQQFGISNEVTIEGPAGTGFIQDTSCYHRATSPTRGDRLMLAVRFIN